MSLEEKAHFKLQLIEIYEKMLEVNTKLKVFSDQNIQTIKDLNRRIKV